MSVLSPFDIGGEDFNSRVNSLKEGGDDEDQTGNKDIEAIQGLGGPVKKAHAKKANETLIQMVTTFIESDSQLQGLKS